MTNYYNSLCNSRDTVYKKSKFGASGGSPNTTKTSRWWLASLFMVMSLFMGQFAIAQVSAYTFSTGTAGVLDPMTGSTQLVAASSDDGASALTTIPFTFKFGGVDYTSFGVNANGILRFGAVTTTASTYYTNSTANATTIGNSIMPYWDDLATGLGGKVHYVVIGTAPNRTLVVEWFVTVPRSTGAAAAAKFQCRLNEGTNTIDLVYGSGMVANTINGGYTIGLATSGTVYNNVVTATNTNSTTVFTTAQTGAITSGRTYTFTPPPPPTCGTASGLTISDNLTGTTVDLAWTAPTLGPPVSYDWEIRTTGAGGSGATGLVANANTSSLTVDNAGTLVQGTAYNLYVRTNCGVNGLSTWVGPTAFTTVKSCPSGLGAGSLVVTLPYNGTGLTNNGAGNNVTATNVACVAGSTSYYGALDKTYIFTPTVTGTYDFLLTTTTDDDAGIMLYQGCPFTLGSVCVANAQSTTGLTRTLSPTLTAGVTYYLVVDNFPSPTFIASYSLSITAQVPPSCASALLPANLSSDVARNPTLSWTAATGSPSSYDVFLGTTSGSLSLVGNVTGTTYTSSILTANTQYFWQVVPKNGAGSATSCVEQSFTTGVLLNYCTPVYTTGKTEGDLIANITISGTTLANNSGALAVNPAYTFFTGQPNYTGDLQAGASYTVNVTVGSFENQNMAAWIDYNDDGVFSTSERIGFTTSSIAANGSASFNISLACNPPLGIHRMRVRDVYNLSGASIDPCASAGYGETEDYNVNVTTADPCPIPKNLASSTITGSGATLNWVLGCAETQWDVLVQLATAPAPTASSTPSNPGLTATTLVATGLNSNTAYNAYVRAVCDSGLGVYSGWSTPVTFTTQGVANCATALVPADLATNVVRNSSMSWTAATANPAVTSYDVYFGNSSPAPFVVNQTAVTYTPATMDANTTYYWKVVAKNSVGDAVGCVEQSFTTGTGINYCTPEYTFGKTEGDLISNIAITGTTLANNSGTDEVNPAYTFFTGQPNYTGDLQAGASYTVNVTVGTFANQNMAAWIDYNDDGVFSTSERIGFTTSSIAANGSASFNISLACNPPLGIHRMRVRDVWNLSGESIDPCASAGYGETEDYLVNVTTADPCPTPSALTASAATATSATLGWKQGCAEAEWDVHVQAVGAGTPSGTPSDPGVLTTSAPGFGTLDVSGLPSGTAYEFYVRAVCETGVSTSNWAGPYTFITVAPGCTSISSPTVTTNLPLGVTVINWNAPAVSASQSAATSYDVYSGTTSGALTLAGNFVSGPLNFTLSAYGTYYVQVIPKNAAGVAVGCAETTFTTIPDPCAGINPPGDTFATAVDLGVLTNAGASASGNNLAANCYRDDYTTTSTIGDATLARAGRDVFYKFEVADVCNTITIGTCTTSMDTYMQILDSTGARINGDDDACTAPNSAGSLLTGITLAPGVYYAVIEGYTATTEGTFTLDIAYTGSAQNTYYVDADGDNYGNSALPTVIACTKPTGYALLNGDCDDANNAINPGHSEVLYNGVDDNCDGQLDEGFEKTTTLSPSSCGAALPFIYSSIAADAKAGATAYDFEITNMTTNAVHHTIRNVNWFRLNETSSFDYGTTYSVRVMLRIGTVWLGYYGDLCSVTTPSISTPASSATIVSPTCGSTLATIFSTINAKAITGVTGYRFRVTRGTEVQTFVTAYNWFKMNQLANYVYGAEYTVEVAYKTTGDYTAYGPACTIFTPAVPTINSCGLTVASGSTISTSPLTGVTLYTFEVTPSGGSAIVFNKTAPNFQVNSIPGYSSATVYSIRVAVTSTGIQSAFGSACTINVPAPTRLSDGNISSEFKAVGYPNPFATNFTLDITTSSDERVKVAVYDMIGKQLENVEVNASESNLLEIGSNYPAGVYNIIVSQGDNVKSLRMIKR